MDNLLEKLGIFDLMGIWCPGAVAVTYYLFSLNSNVININLPIIVTIPNCLANYIPLILYTLISYIVGVILHECGKCLADISNRFNPSSVLKFAATSTRPCTLRLFKVIRYDVNQTLKNTLPQEITKSLNFDEALFYLRYVRGTTKSIDKYHAIYGLSRSLLLAFISHFIILILFGNTCDNCHAIFIYLLSDIILIFIFFLRAYRYYYSWVKNVLIQYYYTKYSE